MKHNLTIKFATIFALILLLLIPIFMISNLIDERNWRHQEVKQDIANSSSKAQQLIGPFLYVSYWHTEHDGKKEIKTLKEHFVLPEEMTFDGTMDTFEKKRGIYSALLYRTDATLTGHLFTESIQPLLKEDLENLSLVMAVSDMRGIGASTKIQLNQSPVTLEPGTQINHFNDGIHIKLDPTWVSQNTKVDFDITMDLLGMESLQLVPVGNKSNVTLSANWPHPSFKGEYLPISSDITDSSFSANWQTSYFATNMQQLMTQCFYQHDCYQLTARSLGVDLIDPVDHYLKSHRAINYALMIIALVFACFFLLEVIRKQPIHPIQYGFVGLALAFFYLLLLSLSEHIGFNLAYIISALASTGLLSSYVASILNNKTHSVLFSAALASLYALMFILLGAEDYALLLGSILIFAVLALIMLLTKNLNWYNNEKEATVQTTLEE